MDKTRYILLGCVTLLLIAFGVTFALTHKKPVVRATRIQTTGSSLHVGQYQAPETINAETILQDINKERVANGLQPLKENPTIMHTAQEKCDDMVKYNYYNHVNPQTGQHGYQYIQVAIPGAGVVGENLAGDSPSTGSQGMVDKWMASPEHKANILDPRYTDTGVATCVVPLYPNNTTAVQQFAQL